MHFRSVLLAVAIFTLPVGLFGQAVSPDSPSDAEILRQYRQRCDLLLGKAVAVDTHDVTKGDIIVVAACFDRGVNLDWANARLAKIDAPSPTGDMFWMYPMLSVMEAGRKNMSPANRARIRELWRTYFPYRGDTENHWLLYYSTLCLAAEANPDAGRDAWYNGKSSAENIAEARSYIEDWMRITTSYGQGEFNSPNYLEEYAAPLAYLAGYERDPKFRREAAMMLDYLFYDYAIEQLDGEYGGAHSRIYPWQVVQPGQTPAAALGWLLFGTGVRQPRGTALILAMSGYAPPPIIYRIARDRTQSYVDLQLKRTRWRMRSPGAEAYAIEGKSTAPVYKYTYMDQDFVLGSCQGGPLQSMQQETWNLIWAPSRPSLTSENTFFGLQPYSSPRVGTMYYVKTWDTAVQSMSTGSVGKLDYDSPDKLEGGSPCEQVFQHGPALIALYDIPPGTRFPLIDTFFSRDLTRREPDASGWIFCQGGPAYFGYRPFAPGEWKQMGWTGHMGSLEGAKGSWFAAGFAAYAKDNLCLVSDSLKNGYIVQVAPARSYRSFDDFKAAVRALPIHFTLDPVPEVTFTALDGSTLHARTGDAPQVDGRALDFSHWPLFDSPYGHAARESGKLEITHGGERYVLDFKNATVEDIPPPPAH